MVQDQCGEKGEGCRRASYVIFYFIFVVLWCQVIYVHLARRVTCDVFNWQQG